jgi:hypothetical protein
MKMHSNRYVIVFALFLTLFLQVPVIHSNSKPLKGIKFTTVVITPPFIKSIFQTEVNSLYQQLKLNVTGLSKDVFALALSGYKKLESLKKISREGILTIVDFSKPSNCKRLFILDLNKPHLVLNTLVAHGKNSGLNYATSFSNQPQSNKSSPGFYTTLYTYHGEKGYALKLKGEEPGINDKAYERNIVVHGSDYVSEKFLQTAGYLGRSLGCPAIPATQSKKVIDCIKGGSCFFIYAPQKNYLKSSRLINS